MRQPMFRIQKLMKAEFHDIYEPVIVENPFTQVTFNGRGLRQYHIGLTRTKIVFGCDDFNYTDLNNFCFSRYLDAEIETFQLVSLLPLQFVRFQFFRKQKREIMRLTICGEENKPMYFEFGGHIYKNLFWHTWRERIASIKLMHPSLLHISGSSPFSSTDELVDDEFYKVEVNRVPSFTTICTSNRSSNNANIVKNKTLLTLAKFTPLLNYR